MRLRRKKGKPMGSRPTAQADIHGWGPNNEFLYEIWPMEIPPLESEKEDDPIELPIRRPTSGLLNNPVDTQGAH